MTETETVNDLKPCPFCAEMIKTKARLCKFCKADIASESPKEIGEENSLAADQYSQGTRTPYTGAAKTQSSALLPIVLVGGFIVVVAVLIGANFMLSKQKGKDSETLLATRPSSSSSASASEASQVQQVVREKPGNINLNFSDGSLVAYHVEDVALRPDIDNATDGCLYRGRNNCNTAERIGLTRRMSINTSSGKHYEAASGIEPMFMPEIQPGAEHQFSTVFLIPKIILQKEQPILELFCHSLGKVKVPLFFDGTVLTTGQIIPDLAAAERERIAAAKPAQVEPREHAGVPGSSSTEAATAAASATSSMPFQFFHPSSSPSPSRAGRNNVEPPQISSIVKKIVQAERESKTDISDQGRSELDRLQKPQAGDDLVADSFNKSGVKALNAKDYKKAVELLSSAAKANPSVAKYYSNLGFAEMYAHDLSSAENHTYQSLALNPDRIVAWNNLGQIYAKQGNQDDAVSCFLVAFRLSKGQSLAYLKSLDADDDQVIRSAGRAALGKLPVSLDQPAIVSATLPSVTAQSGSEAVPARIFSPVNESLNYGPYMQDLQARIKRAWHPLKGGESKKAKVVFTVSRDGSITRLHTVNSAGDAAVDAAGLKAVENAAPFRPLPEGAPTSVDIEFTFDYNAFNGGGHSQFRNF